MEGLGVSEKWLLGYNIYSMHVSASAVSLDYSYAKKKENAGAHLHAGGRQFSTISSQTFYTDVRMGIAFWVDAFGCVSAWTISYLMLKLHIVDD